MSAMFRTSRRGFIALGGMALAGVACTKEEAPPRPVTGTLSEILAGRRQSMSIGRAWGEVLSGRVERIPFGLINPTGSPEGTPFPVSGATGRMWLAQALNGDAIGPFDIREVGGDDVLRGRGLYETDAEIPSDGIWFQLIEATPPGATEPLVAVGRELQVGEVPNVKNFKPGDRAPRVATPTPSKPRGVDPICTRADPCSMHKISLDDALRQGMPTVVTIGTPGYCQSQFCGPVVDVLEAAAADTPEVAFIHIELLRDDETETIQTYQGVTPGESRSPAAIAWNTFDEPITYYIDDRGIIAERHHAAIDEVDIADGLATITG